MMNNSKWSNGWKPKDGETGHIYDADGRVKEMDPDEINMVRSILGRGQSDIRYLRGTKTNKTYAMVFRSVNNENVIDCIKHGYWETNNSAHEAKQGMMVYVISSEKENSRGAKFKLA